MHNSITENTESISGMLQMNRKMRKKHSPWKDIDYTSSYPFMADTTNPLIRDRNMPRSRILGMTPITDKQVRLCFDIPHLTEVRRDPGFI